MTLTEKQQQELEAAGDAPVRIVLPTNREYVVLRADVYDRMRALAEDLTSVEVGHLVERTMREYDEEDPTLATYRR